MYIPKHFQVEDHAEIIEFMRRYSFATLINTKNNYPEATHLPFIIDQIGDKLILSSHFAKANSQAEYVETNPSLVIFTEPHAYISPANYEKEQNVPTWNYIAIHAYGDAKIVHDEEDKLAMLEKMIGFYDTGYMVQWQSLPMDYKLKMIKGIVAFDITVDDLQAKKKLSQNRSEKEKDNVINRLDKSPQSNEQEIATYMQAMKDRKYS